MNAVPQVVGDMLLLGRACTELDMRGLAARQIGGAAVVAGIRVDALPVHAFENACLLHVRPFHRSLGRESRSLLNVSRSAERSTHFPCAKHAGEVC